MYPGKPRPRGAGPYGDVFPRPRSDRPYGGVLPGWIGSADSCRQMPAVGPVPGSPYLTPPRTPGEAAWRKMVDRVSGAWKNHPPLRGGS
jgi:hypothetical protein